MDVLRQFIKILHDRVDEAPPSRLVMHERSMDALHLPRSPHVQQTSRVGTPWTARQLSSVQLKPPRTQPLQGPIIQVWPSGQITLTGDVIGSMGSTMGYEATMVFRDLAIKLLGS